MTNKMKLIFIITAVVSAAFLILGTPFAVDIADEVLAGVANALDLHEVRTPSALAVLAISGLYLHFAFAQRRHS
jgi:hypothetical protein